MIRSERGFSMVLVIIVMLLTAMFVAAGFAAANGDLPISGNSMARKQTYAAAEAGLNFYLNHLQQDNDYWTHCDQVPAPNASELNPVNQQWSGVGADPRRWRTVPGSSAQYTIELLHTSAYSKCETDPTKQDSMIDLSSGTFRIRVTGRPSPTSTQRRSIIATFRRDGFLNYIYFTDQEQRDPQLIANSAERQAMQTACAGKYRSGRAAVYAALVKQWGEGCTEIQFISADAIHGPLHTNDESVLVCGTPTFGRTDHVDAAEVSGGKPGFVQNGSTCTGTPTFNTPTKGMATDSKQLGVPTSNQSLSAVAEAGGLTYKGKTIIRLKTSAANVSTMDVTNYDAKGNATTTTDVAWPTNGVLYVDNNGICTGDSPLTATYNEPATCGDVYVSGTYNRPLTIAAANDVIIAPTTGAKLPVDGSSNSNKSADADIRQYSSSDAMLGLIANNFIRVMHRVTRNSGSCVGNVNTSTAPEIDNVHIDAAMLSLQHSFLADNYDCGKLGTLTVDGAIAQRYRGPVGTSGGSVQTGFVKDYWYDDRFRYRSPPYFMNPVDSAWDVVQQHEQVPAR